MVLFASECRRAGSAAELHGAQPDIDGLPNRMHRGLRRRPAAGLYNGGLHEWNDTQSQNFQIKVSSDSGAGTGAGAAEWTQSNQNHTPCDFCITTSPTRRGIEQNAWPWRSPRPRPLQLLLLLLAKPICPALWTSLFCGSALLDLDIQISIQLRCRRPYFEVSGLTSGLSYNVFLIAQNSKGRSNATILQVYTLKDPEKQTGEFNHRGGPKMNPDAGCVSYLSVSLFLSLCVCNFMHVLAPSPRLSPCALPTN